jgi:hypothetical protein
MHALLNRSTATESYSAILCLVLDSGCTRHCHPHEKDLINCRRTRETMSGILGKPSPVTCIGDLPVIATDAHGRQRRVLIRNVRCVPAFTETLISVDRLWDDSKAEVRFADHKKITVKAPDSSTICKFPFRRAPDRLYIWSVISERRIANDVLTASLSSPQNDLSTWPATTGLSHTPTWTLSILVTWQLLCITAYTSRLTSSSGSALSAQTSRHELRDSRERRAPTAWRPTPPDTATALPPSTNLHTSGASFTLTSSDHFALASSADTSTF